MPPLKAVVFDLDDTLYPEREYVASGLAAVARWCEQRMGLSARETEAEFWDLHSSGDRGLVFNRWLERHGLSDPGNVEAMIGVYRAHDPSITLAPAVAALLGRLRQRYRLGLLTDGYLDTQRRKVAALRLSTFLDAAVFSDAFGADYWKPSLVPFTVVLERLGAAAAEAVYVADNPDKDFVGARRTGMLTVRVRAATGLYADRLPPSPLHRPDTEIDDIGELESALGRLENGKRPARSLNAT